MKRSNPFLRLLVIGSSLLLLGAFVAYHAGAFQGIWGAPGRSADSQVRSNAVSFEEAGPDAPFVMSGSKSPAIFPLISPPATSSGSEAPANAAAGQQAPAPVQLPAASR